LASLLEEHLFPAGPDMAEVQEQEIFKLEATDFILIFLVAVVLLWVVPRQLLHYHRSRAAEVAEGPFAEKVEKKE
jgi:hypothetical protein